LLLNEAKIALTAILLVAGVAACDARPAADPGQATARSVVARAGGLGDSALTRVDAGMDRSMLALARRFDPAPRADLWDRPPGWSPLDLVRAPALAVGALTPADAQALNALMPVANDALTPAPPFVLRASGPERERAQLCMAQAIYYEAALEPLSGQQAVAQTILNRLRHPDFPKSVCGVVYQGAEQATGCQFSFTCDGSRERAPVEPYWSQAEAVAAAALDGFVQPAVGSATHYHADYVFPRWGPQMVKIGQIGAHIFYRFPGPIGQVEALSSHYLGGELKVSMAGPSAETILAAKAAAGAADAPAPTLLAAADAPTSPADLRPREPGQIVYGRRVPSRDEIARINAQIADLTDKVPPPAAPAS
jgi:spore germination cell wall hydrolase CwlJ-like protein